MDYYNQICLKYKPNKEILSRLEGEKILLFDPRRRKIFLLSELAYKVLRSFDSIKTFKDLLDKNQLSSDEGIYVLEYFIKEKLIVET